jgi:hypothetical protein
VLIAIIIVGILIAAAGFGFNAYLGQQRKARLLAAGRILEREADFFKQAHYFTTKTGKVSDIGIAIDHALLTEERISFEPHYEQGGIVFHKGGVGGTFGAVLRSMEPEGGLYRYRFQVESWRESNSDITQDDFYGANVLLTAIEKAFMQLDRDTEVQRLKAEYKTKTKFF